MAAMVDIGELRVGMFVHLELGWWAHPFALSSFMITSDEQIAVIRTLGKPTLRWSPERSRLDDEVALAVPAMAAAVSLPAPADAPATPDEPGTVAGPGAVRAGLAVVPPSPQASPSNPAAAAAPAAPAARSAAPSARVPVAAAPLPTAEAAALHQQQAAEALCRQQVAEARSDWIDASRLVARAPEQARVVTEGLTAALLDKLMVDCEMCVRVLSDASVDPVAGHALNVTVVSLLMGRVFGLGAAEMMDLGVGALLHDIGKLDLPERARHADRHSSPAEQMRYREHVAHGVRQGQRMGLSAGALLVIAQHHELADGSGFPQQLALDRMAIAARIVALVDRYDNLCNPRGAGLAMTPHEALSAIFAQSKRQFDSTMLNAFIRMMGVYPPGSVVQLTDDRYATVVSVNSSRPLKPRVLVCEPSVPADQALLLNLDTAPDLGIRRSVKPAQLPLAVRDYLSPAQRVVYFFEPVALHAAEHSEELAA